MNLKVVSFNIRCCDDPNGNSRAERAPRVNAVIDDIKPDLIGFQEMRPGWEPYFKEFFYDTYDIFFMYRNKTVDIETCPILWKKDKFECIKTGYFWLSDTPEVESRAEGEGCYRICLYAILKEKASGKTFTFMNTHFGFGDNVQIMSAKLINDYSNKISDLPTFITGDFNMRPDFPAYKVMTENFTDVNAVTANDGRATYHGYEPEKYSLEHIDYCFIKNGIKAINQKIRDDMPGGKYPSDHYGLEIDIEI